MENLPILALIFTITFALLFLALSTLMLAVREEDLSVEPVARVFGPFTEIIAGFLPTTAHGREVLQRDLWRAGFLEPVALVNFLAVRSVMTYVPLLAGEIGAVLTEGNTAIGFFLTGLVGGLLGYALPRLILLSMASRRTEAIRRGLPMLMDTMGLMLSTGASLTAALARAGEAIRRGNPELSHEVRVVIAHAQMRSLSHALERWKDRQPIPELGSFVYLLSQADRLGTDITRGLWELSSSLQVNARQRAEAAANRANFFMVFPTVLCLLIAAGLILAGPGIVRLFDAKRELDGVMERARESEDLIKKKVDLTPRTRVTPVPPAPAPGTQPPVE